MMSGSVMGKVFFHLPVCLLFLPGDRCILPVFSLFPVQDIFFLQGKVFLSHCGKHADHAVSLFHASLRSGCHKDLSVSVF